MVTPRLLDSWTPPSPSASLMPPSSLPSWTPGPLDDLGPNCCVKPIIDNDDDGNDDDGGDGDGGDGDDDDDDDVMV